MCPNCGKPIEVVYKRVVGGWLYSAQYVIVLREGCDRRDLGCVMATASTFRNLCRWCEG